MNRKKILIILTSIALFLNQAVYTVYAQTPTPTPFLFRSESKIWRTIVGNVPGTKGPREEIVIWAEKIINELKLTNCGNRYNRMLANITNDGSYYATKRTAERCIESDETGIYHSTYLIIDAYNLTGFKGFTTTNYGSVARLITAWKAFSSTSDEYIFLDYQSNKKLLVSVEPGNVVFFQRKPFQFDPNDHVAIVHKEIQIDSVGNGQFFTYDANNTKTVVGPYTVKDYNIEGAPTGTTVVGFGGIANTSGLPGGSPPGGPGGPPVSPPPAPAGKFSCPLAGSIITCGSYYTPVRGCGHCLPGGGYGPVNPLDTPQCFAGYAPGTRSAIDIGIPGGFPANKGQPLILPSFAGQAIEWKYVGQEGTRINEKIIKFSGYNTVSAQRYYLQFHHSKPTTIEINTKFTSGQTGANICEIAGASDCDHSHVQIIVGSETINQNLWADSAKSFDCP